jgi:hypothetical protein
MATTFTKIADVTVGSGGAASIDFTSIPSTYTDLCLVFSLRSSDGSDYCGLKFNNSSSSFSSRQIYGNGSGAGSTTRSNNDLTGSQTPSVYTSNVFSNNAIYIPNYTGSANKSYSRDSVFENNGTNAIQTLEAGIWSNTSAINQVTLVHPSATFVQYSTATLYGVSNA